LGAHRSVLKHYSRQRPGITTSGQFRKGAMGAASMPKSWVPSRGSAPYSWWVTVLLLQHPYRFLLDRVENDAIRTRGLGLL